ncbi:MAG: cyclic 2,3-diphosphoglycerate synthase [Burkholderiales bacterium]
MTQEKRVRTLILGAAGRDFHNFNVAYRQNRSAEVVAFTAAQITGIAGRRYPPSLAGDLYPDGIPIVDEAELERMCREHLVGQVVLAYSDISREQVMHLASRALASGADFVFLGPERTMLKASVPVIAVSAVRTGCGKSQVARWLSAQLKSRGLRVGVIRHPMPYGDLERQAVQQFAALGDLDAADCTIEEREEYEPHLALGNTVYAGVDYARILPLAESESDVLVWDGGNNDFPFVRPDLHIVLVDALRPGQETTHHPGETVLRMADVVVIAKADAACADSVSQVEANVRAVQGRVPVVRGGSPIRLDDETQVRGKTVLVIEDGPSMTHGDMPWGAGYVAATRAGAAQIIDPRSYAEAEIADVFARYPHLGPVLPAIGYSKRQIAALARTIERVPADMVVAATPIDLKSLAGIDKPVMRARYEYAELESPGLTGVVEAFLKRAGLAA